MVFQVYCLVTPGDAGGQVYVAMLQATEPFLALEERELVGVFLPRHPFFSRVLLEGGVGQGDLAMLVDVETIVVVTFSPRP